MTVRIVLDEAEKLMSEFFDTHAYNEQSDWRDEPLTDEDPDDLPDGGVAAFLNAAMGTHR